MYISLKVNDIKDLYLLGQYILTWTDTLVFPGTQRDDRKYVFTVSNSQDVEAT